MALIEAGKPVPLLPSTRSGLALDHTAASAARFSYIARLTPPSQDINPVRQRNQEVERLKSNCPARGLILPDSAEATWVVGHQKKLNALRVGAHQRKP